MREKVRAMRREERERSQNKEYHLLLSWSRHGEERLEAEYNDTHNHDHETQKTQRGNKRINKKRKRIKNE